MNLEIRAGIAGKKAAFKNRITEIRKHDGDIKKKLLLSASLGAVTLGVNWGGIPALALKESKWAKGLAPDSLNPGLVLGLGYGIYTVSYLVNLIQQRRLLERINISQDFPATVVFHGLGKIGSLKEKRVGRSIAAVSTPTLPSLAFAVIVREPALYSFAALSPEGMWGLAMLKSAQGVFNLVQSGAAEIVLRTKGRGEKKTQNLPAKAVVVDMKRN